MLEKGIEEVFNHEFNFVFEDLSQGPKEWSTSYEDLEKTVSDVIEWQIRNFQVQKDAICKYQEENVSRFCQEEEALKERTTILETNKEKAKADVKALEGQIKEIEKNIKEERKNAQQLENERKHLLSEKDKVLESLEQLRKAYELALMLYQRNLGMILTIDRNDHNRFVVTFEAPTHIMRRVTQRKESILKTNDGYQLSDGKTLRTNVELMAFLVKERRQWLTC